MRYLSRMISLLVLLSLLLLLLRLLHCCDIVIVGQDGRKGIVSAMQGLPPRASRSRVDLGSLGCVNSRELVVRTFDPLRPE